jgi:molybdopterin converting factor small subunit
MPIRVEFFGIARARAGISSAEVPAQASGATLAEVLRLVGDAAPALGDNELIVNGRLHASLAANLDGQRFISDPATPIRDGQCLLILSADAGG